MIVEGSVISFAGESSKIHVFAKTHSSSPVVSLTAEGSIADVNLYVSSVSVDQVTIEASEDFTGNVHLHAWSS